jgi:hypothetical protein
MQFLKSNKTALITTFAVLALATTAFTVVADARPRHGKVRHQTAAFTGDNTAVDDRYAHAQGGFAPMMQQPTSRRAARQPRQNPAMIGIGHSGAGCTAAATRNIHGIIWNRICPSVSRLVTQVVCREKPGITDLSLNAEIPLLHVWIRIACLRRDNSLA